MKTRTTRIKTASASRLVSADQLTWSHLGSLYRITAWPEARLERLDGDRWIATVEDEDVMAAGMVEVDATAWKRYMEFMPAAERAFVSKFRFGRLAALLIIARCPQLVADLDETPALVSFLAAHTSLRGTGGPRWDEIAAVHERGGVFAVLEWLGVPASRETLSILRNLVDPDVPRHLLEPLRVLLWRPAATFVLQRTPELTDRQLARYCHALAA